MASRAELLQSIRSERREYEPPRFYVSMGIKDVRQVGPFIEEVHPLQDDQARIRTLKSGVSAGTDRPYFNGNNIYQLKEWDEKRQRFVRRETPEVRTPSFGYMLVGQVEESKRSGLQEGLRVAGKWGNKSGHTLDAHERVIVLPDEISDTRGIYAAQFGVVCANTVAKIGISEAGPRRGDKFGEGIEGTALLMGGGGIGMLTSFHLREAGATEIIIADPIEEKVEFFNRQFAKHGIKNIKMIVNDLKDPEGMMDWIRGYFGGAPDISHDGTGHPSALKLLFGVADIDSTVYTASYFPEGREGVLDDNAHRKNLTVKNLQVQTEPYGYTREELEDVNNAMLMHPQYGPIIDAMTNHEVPLSEMQSAFEALDASTPENPHPAAKIDQYRKDPEVPVVQIALHPDEEGLTALMQQELVHGNESDKGHIVYKAA